ncbi:MAG: MBOAT family protein, partial [Clostridiales bacterium]|nr:MBOAT family protein [Clostridiales bacterium]
MLAASYYFYMSWNRKYVGLMLLSTLITYLSGILLGKAEESDLSANKKLNKKRWIVAGSFIVNLGILFFFKYFNFASETLDQLFGAMSIQWSAPVINVLLPVGISFYTFQALSYTADVYYGRVKPEYHFGHYALFVSFFPQLVAGPIERTTRLLPQLKRDTVFDPNR